MRLGICGIVLFFAFFITTTPALAVDITLSTAGDGIFSVNGAAMDGVSGLKLTIGYNSSVLSAPVVHQGGLVAGAMMAANTNTPGTITVGIISSRSFSGSGQILGIIFSNKSGHGGITSLKAEAFDSKPAPLQARVSINPDAQMTSTEASPPGGSPFPDYTASAQNQPVSQNQPVTASGNTTATAATPSIGTITLPGDGRQPEPPKSQEQPVINQPQVEQTPPPAAATATKDEPQRTAEAKATAEKKTREIRKISFTPVIDRFKTFKGERTIAAFTELFTKPVTDEARQEPPIVVSDGKQKIRLLAGFSAQDDDAAPNFASNEARILSLKPEESSGRWLIELLPAKDSMTAVVSILLGTRLFEIPLVTLPPTRKLTFSEKEVAAFLKDAAAAKPEFDLNADGRHDYIDDYLYSGHYLLGKDAARDVAGSVK